MELKRRKPVAISPTLSMITAIIRYCVTVIKCNPMFVFVNKRNKIFLFCFFKVNDIVKLEKLGK